MLGGTAESNAARPAARRPGIGATLGRIGLAMAVALLADLTLLPALLARAGRV